MDEKGKTAKDLWDAQHTQFVGIKLNRRTDADILAALEAADSKQGFIKEAIRYYLSNITSDTE